MPELPEVETVVRGLKRTVLGKTVRRVRVLHPKPLGHRSADWFRRRLRRQTITAVERHGKFIVLTFASGLRLVAHLRMTGNFSHCADDCARRNQLNKHTRLVFEFTDGGALLYHDLRLFGTLELVAAGLPLDLGTRIGPDPFSPEVTAAWLLARLRDKRLAIKAALLDQQILSGLGNIYANEALFAARLPPDMPANRLKAAQARALLTEIRAILRAAIAHGGTTVSDFRNVEQGDGGYQALLKVYGREDEPCPRCKNGHIKRVKIAQRSTFFCPRCQKSGRHTP